MQLFTDKKRTRTKPKRPGEPEYRFYNETNWPELDTYRALINSWIAELPEPEQADIVARFRKADSLGYQAALAELAGHAALIRRGHKVQVHPPSAHPSRRPDFLVRTKDDVPVAIVEVTTFGPAQEDVAQSTREATIYNALDAAELPPGYRLLFDVEAPGAKLPKIAALRKEVEEWARAHANVETAPDEDPPSRVFEAGDWRIELKLIGGYNKERPATRAIGGAMGKIRHVKAEEEIRDALEKKGSRYGQLNVPYLIVVADCKEELQGGEYNSEALIDAVCGTYAQSVAFPSGEMSEGRQSNGYWWRGGKPAHTGVSGVLLLPKPHLWDLRNERWQPLMVYHPFGAHPLPDDLLGLPFYRHDPEKNEMVKHKGVALADTLGLPEPWPPEKT